MSKKLSHGTVHQLPVDLADKLQSNKVVSSSWENITPLARNEFICWVEDAKQEKTRLRRIKRTCEELLEGQKRPCCWVGCVHRKDKPLNKTQKWLLAGRK